MKKRHTPEQIVRKLRQAEDELAAGASVPEVARRLGISEATFHRWRNHYGGMKADAMKRLKLLEASAYPSLHSTVSKTSCALGRNSSNSFSGAETSMTTVSPPTPTMTNRSLNPL